MGSKYLLLVFLVGGSRVCEASKIFKTTAERRGVNSSHKNNTAFYNQTLDHFTFTTDEKFPQKYLMNDTWWVPGGPIFFYTGNEGVIEAFAENSGFMWDIAPEFNALLIFAEHRYYGESLPFNGNFSKDPHKLGYLSSEEALADFAELISFIKATLPNAYKSPVIAFGGSYGGIVQLIRHF